MNSNSTGFPLTIVSTDRTALREVSWTLSAYGYEASATSDWSEQATWHRSSTPGLVILDARDAQQIEIALTAARSTPYTYRIALYDATMLGDPDLLMELGADELIRYPLNVGELLSSIRRGARRLEFERRFNLAATFDQQRGVANRRGFTLQLERKSKDNRETADNAIVVLGIDFLEEIRAHQGSIAVENACAHVAELVYGGLSSDDCRGILAEGIFAVMLCGQSISDGVLFATELNEQLATIIGKGCRISLSAVVAGWPSDETAETTIQRALSALERIRGWGGNQALEVSEVEREYTAWNLRFTGQQETNARHAMEALPLVLPLNPSQSIGDSRTTLFRGGPMPPCVPVVDDIGHLVGVVDVSEIQAPSDELFRTLDEHLEPVSTTLSGDSRLDEIVTCLESGERDYLLVVDNKKPIGYVTHETVAALQANTHPQSSHSDFAADDYELSSLVVP